MPSKKEIDANLLRLLENIEIVIFEKENPHQNATPKMKMKRILERLLAPLKRHLSRMTIAIYTKCGRYTNPKDGKQLPKKMSRVRGIASDTTDTKENAALYV